MQYTDERHHLRVDFRSRGFDLGRDELARMEQRLGLLGEAVAVFPESRLTLNFIHHPRSKVYHVEARLKLPGKTLFSSDYGDDYRMAFDRLVRKLGDQVGHYRDNPDQGAEKLARQRAALNRDVVAPEGPDIGPLGQAVQDRDYKTFRRLLSGYEEWLRNRIGRWVQRYPEAQAQVGDELRLGDLLEEVYLNAFEHYPHWPREVPFHEWLDGLIDPSLREFLRHPDEERENASMARTLRDTPLP
jgi:ribosome-associated translation inhibitor RaiA